MIDWECTYQVGKKVIILVKFANKTLVIIYKQLKFKSMGNESNKTIPKEPCKTHKALKYPYLAWQAYAKERTKKGDKQTRCEICGRWYFQDEL